MHRLVQVDNDVMTVLFEPKGTGEFHFEFMINGYHAVAHGLCVPAFEELLKRRIDFIVEKQQNLDPHSSLYGAYLIYDNEDHKQYNISAHKFPTAALARNVWRWE